MKVKELIEELMLANQEALVIISKDSEGNYYSPCSGFYDGVVYVANTTWSGDIMYSKLTKELEEAGYGEDDIDDTNTGVPAVVLQPIN